MRRIGNSRPTSLIGGHDISLAIQAQGRSGSMSANNASGMNSASGSGSATVRESRSGQGRGSFRELALGLSQARSGLNIAGSPNERVHTQAPSATTTPRPAFLQLEPPARAFQAIPPPAKSITSESTTSDTDDRGEDDERQGEESRHRALRRTFRTTRILSPSEPRSGGSSPTFLPFLAGDEESEEGTSLTQSALEEALASDLKHYQHSTHH